MTLFQSWADSLSLLKPKNLKLFLLVTLKAGVDTYKILLKNWLYVFLMPFGCCIVPYLLTLLFVQLVPLHITHFFSFNHILAWIYQAVLFASLVASRPSLEQKDGAYFRRNMIYFLPITLLLLFLPRSSWPTAVSPLYFFTVLFYLDSPKRMIFMRWIKSVSESDVLMSFWRALKMVVYNLPLLFMVALILMLPFHVYNHCCPYAVHSLIMSGITLRQILGAEYLIAIVLAPFIVCLYTNIYIKKLHDQFDLYFKQPS